MLVLIYTRVFAPMVGGMETITMQLAQMLANQNEPATDEAVQVTVVTPTPAGTMRDEAFPFLIVHKPSFVRLLRLIWHADILHVAGTDMLPLFLGWLLGKCTVVEHHGFQTDCPNGQLTYEHAQPLCS